MNYRQAVVTAISKRTLGWLVFIPACISTCISVLKFLLEQKQNSHLGVQAVALDFIRLMAEMIRHGTHFLSWFWQHAPALDFNRSNNFGFWLIYLLMFIALALNASGGELWRQTRRIKDCMNDQYILQQAEGGSVFNRQQVEAKVKIPSHSLFLQFFPLYLLPIILTSIGYFIFKFVGVI